MSRCSWRVVSTCFTLDSIDRQPFIQNGGGLYSDESVAVSLQECFDRTRRLFDYPVGGISRCKFVVTATTTQDASTVIFPSYNLPPHGEGVASEDEGERPLATYRRITRDWPEAEPYP